MLNKIMSESESLQHNAYYTLDAFGVGGLDLIEFV